MLSELDDWMSDEGSDADEEREDEEEEDTSKKKKNKVQSKSRTKQGEFYIKIKVLGCSYWTSIILSWQK